MKQEDFERLKAKLGDEFKAEYRVEKDSVMVLVTKKDIWEGVKFVDNGYVITKIKSINKRFVFYEAGGFNHISECKPSTEEAYIEQLKKEAFERFGEISDGDVFDIMPIGYTPSKCKINLSNQPAWSYNSGRDELSLDGFIIYKQDKWVERVEKTEVFFRVLKKSPNSFIAEFSANQNFENKEEVAEMLASYLEKYLNEK